MDNSKKLLLGLKMSQYNPDTHVRVRVLHNEELPFDFTTGKRKYDPSEAPEDISFG